MNWSDFSAARWPDWGGTDVLTRFGFNFPIQVQCSEHVYKNECHSCTFKFRLCPLQRLFLCAQENGNVNTLRPFIGPSLHEKQV